MSAPSTVLMKKKDLLDIYESFNGLKSELPSLTNLNVDTDLTRAISNLKAQTENISALSLLFNYYSITENNKGISELLPLLQELSNQNKKNGVFFFLQGAHQLRQKNYKDAIKTFEQSLRYESNVNQRQEIFYRIAFSLFKLGSLQALHYISIIKTTDTDLLGRISLLEGLIYFEILKNLEKTNHCFKQALDAFRQIENRYYEHIVLQHLSELYEVQGLSDQSEKYKKEVNRFIESLTEKTKPKEIKKEKKSETIDRSVPFPEEFNQALKSLGHISLQELEKRYILFVLEQSQSLDEACKTLGVDRKTLYNKRKAWNII